MNKSKLSITIDLKGKDELNDILQKLLHKYEIDASADLGSIKNDIEKNINKPMRNVKTQFAEWGLVINGIRGAIQAVGTVYNTTIGAMIKAAQTQESAEIALKGALRATGLEVENNSRSLARYAATLQKATIYGDEMLMKAMAQMQNIARFDNTETLKKATKAAIGLSAAFGVDLATAMDLVGKAGAGNTGMLGRYGIVLDETASQAEKFNQVLEIGAGYFGIAEDQATSSMGSIEQMKNAWGDLQEALAEGLLPVMKDMVRILTPMIEAAGALSGEQKAMTIGLIIANALVVKHTLAIMAQKAAFMALSIEQQKQVASMMMVIAAQGGGTVTAIGFSGAMRALGASFVSAGAAVKGFLTSIGPVGWIIIGITGAYAGLNAILKVNTKAMKDMIDAKREAIEINNQEIAKKEESAKATLKLTERYKQLVGQTKISQKEEKELFAIHGKMAEKYPSLVSKTESYVNSLKGIEGAAKRAKEELAKLSWEQWQNSLKLIKLDIEGARVESFEKLSKEFNWRDLAFTGTRATALAGVKEDMDKLISTDGLALGEAYLQNLAKRFEDFSKQSKKFNKGEQVALLRASSLIHTMIIKRKQYNALLSEDVTESEPETSEDGGGREKDLGGEMAAVIKELEEYRLLREASFDAEEAEIKKLERSYAEKLKLVAGNASDERDLAEKRDREIKQIQDKYSTEQEKAEADHYENLKFYAEGYYDWKINQIKKESKSEAWKQDQISALNKERAEWDNRAIKAFEEQYNAEMSRLAELRELGLATHSEVAEAAWEHYDALMAIVEADGEISERERELLDIYRKRGQKAQLAVNRESDLASYYNEIRFHDSAYYDWKKARIEEDVRLMDISEEQKAALIKVKVDALKKEIQDFAPEISVFDHLLTAMDIPEEHQAKIKNSFQSLANQISAIWSQLFTNLASSRDQSLKNLESRAKKERKTEAWLAKEKEKINADYEKKYKALKRTEQKIQIASATVNTLEGITNALTIKPAWLAPIMATAAGVLGFAQVKLIAEQKFARGGDTSGLFRGKGTTTSDSNIIAISDKEYIIAADRVRRFGVPFFDALNFGSGEHIRSALAAIKFPVSSPPPPTRSAGFASGGSTAHARSLSRDITMNVTLKCDSKNLAKAVIKGKKKIIST